MKSKFITFEGGEGAGKTTLIHSLAKIFKEEGHDVLLTRAPGGTPYGNKIRDLILHDEDIPPATELFLYLADRAYHVENLLKPALASGKLILCDRYNDSTIVYQGERGFSNTQLEELCKMATDDLTPDLTFYLNLDPKIGMQRLSKERQKDRLERESLAFHQKVRERYLERAQKEPSRIHVLDATKSPEALLQETKTLIEQSI